MSTIKDDDSTVPLPPPGWGEDGLARFLDYGRCNVFAAFVHWPAFYNLLRDINGCFEELLKLEQPSAELLPGIFALRSQSAFLASTGCALSAQVVDVYPNLRACIESSMYALYVSGEPALQVLWARRHESTETRRRVRDVFSYGKILQRIREVDAASAGELALAYDLTIDLGAHPNQQGLFRNVKTTADADNDYFELRYINSNSQVHVDALGHCVEIGLIALKVIGHALPDRIARPAVQDALTSVLEQRSRLRGTSASSSPA